MGSVALALFRFFSRTRQKAGAAVRAPGAAPHPHPHPHECNYRRLGTHFYQNDVILLVIRGPASASRCKALMSALTEWPIKPEMMHVVHCAALYIPWHQEWSMASQLLALCMEPHTSAISTTAKTTESIKIMMSNFQNAAGIQCSSGCIVNKYVK